jgi:hypothetical protein
MTDIKFDEIWNKIIKPYLNSELSANGSLQSTDPTKNFTNARRDIKAFYDNMRLNIKTQFMRNSEGLLDRHKLPACLCLAVMNTPLIKISGCNLQSEKTTLANAGLAIHVAISILLSFVAKNASDEYSQHLKNNGLLFPKNKNTDSSESYLIQTAKALCYAHRANKLTVPTTVPKLANIFFLIESYNDSVFRKK